MAKVRTFSRSFPKGHPKAGQPTYFVEKVWQSLYNLGLSYGGKFLEQELENFSNPSHFISPKHHTIRAGNHFKVGDKFSPRVWSGNPYSSKQIIIAPDIEVKKVWTFEMIPALFLDECQYLIDANIIPQNIFDELAKNDGLSTIDFANWFCGSEIMSSKRKKFTGQIICWSDKVDY